MTEKICPICGKKFIVTHCTSYLYKIRKSKAGKLIYYCGYNCYRKDNSEQPFKRSKWYI